MKKCYMAMIYMAIGAGAALLMNRYYDTIMRFMDKEVECVEDMAENKLDELKGNK